MKLGIIGFGNMGQAIASGAIESRAVDPENIYIREYNEELTIAKAKQFGGNPCFDLTTLKEKVDVIILAVKPNNITKLGETLSQHQTTSPLPLFISIAAGVTLETLKNCLPIGSRIIRTMPNTPTLIGAGSLAYTLGSFCTQQDESKLISLMEGASRLIKVNEYLMDAVTGLSGSGPAYVYMFIEALADGGVKEGLPREQALELAAQTVLGSAKMVLESQSHPAVLKDQVASPGGTTIAGIAALEKAQLRSAVIQAVEAATKRSKELA